MTVTPSDNFYALVPGTPKQGRVAALLGDLRLKPLWVMLLTGWILFSGFRAGLFLARLFLARLGEMANLGPGNVARCFLMGMRYDAMVLGYAILPLVLVLSLARDRQFARPRFRRWVVAYATAIVTIGIFIEIIGVGFFLKFDERMDWKAFSYLFRHPKVVLGHIWNVYPIWLLLPAMAVICYVVYRMINRLFSRGHLAPTTLWRRAVQAVALTALCILACRGGLRPLRRGSAYFTSNFLVTQLTMNNFVTMFHAAKNTLTEGGEIEREYSHPPVAEAVKTTAGMLFQAHDTPVQDGPNPLWRRTQTNRPRLDYNVVVIIMEGMSCRPVGALGYSPSHTPNLDGLCARGMFFERMYAAGRRTSRAMVAILCGHPDLVGTTLLELERSQGKFLTLPSIFRERGYETLFVYGGDPEFDNMKGFFSAGGIETFICEKQMDASQIPGEWNWGLPDEVIFDKAAEEFDKLGDRKFFAVILTVSNHDPYTIPPGRVEELQGHDEDTKRLNGYRYSDWALGRFFRRIESSPYFGRTIFVLVADHAHNPNPAVSIDVPGYRVPCLFYAPAIIPPQRISTVCSQTDIGPTLLAVLGGSFEHCFMGRNVLAVAPGDGFAMMHQGDLGFVRGDTALVLPPRPMQKDQPIPVLFRTDWYRMDPIAPDKADPRQLRSLQNEMLSYYVTARHLYMMQSYHRHPAPPSQPPTKENAKDQ